MAQNYAEKFSPKVQESFKINSLTDRAINHDYEFIGVKTVKVYSVDTVGMQNYNPTGSNNRYGTANNLGDTKQELTVEVDRSFTFTVDRMDDANSMGILNPGKALQRQIEQVVVPEVDKYRLAKIVDDKNKIDDKAVISNTNAYEKFLDAITTLLDKGVPMAGCFAYINTNFYKQIRLDKNFIQASDMAQEMRVKGVVGMIEGIPLVHVPTSYFPVLTTTHSTFGHLDNLDTLLSSNEKINFILMNKAAVVGVEKLADYKVHDNPPGINGWLVEGRMVYDAFVLDKKKDMIYISSTPS